MPLVTGGPLAICYSEPESRKRIRSLSMLCCELADQNNGLLHVQ